MIRAVIFDLGHTLWDIDRHDDQATTLRRSYEAMRAKASERLGHSDLPEVEALIEAVGQELRRTYFDVVRRELAGGCDQGFEQPPSHVWVDAGCRALGLELDEALLLELTPPLFATESDWLICAEGTREAVEEVARAGYRVGCVTNTLAYESTIRDMLRRHGFESLMESVVVSSSEGRRKPHRSLFEKAMRELEARPRESVFVGDSPFHDIAGAKACGMGAVLTRQYVTRPYDDALPQPDAIIDHLRELPEIIARLNTV